MEVRTLNNVTVINTTLDSLDASNAKDLKCELLELLQNHKNVVLDLSSISFLDSSGLGALLSCFRYAKENGGSLSLSSPTATVKNLLELVRMDKVFDIYESESEATSKYGA